MNLAQLMQAARIFLDDQTQPVLWSDDELKLYLNEAQREACVRGSLLEDKTTEAICTVPIVAGTAEYALDPRVLRVKRFKLDSQDTPLERTSIEWLDDNYPGWETASASTPRHYYELIGKVALVRKPVADDTGRLLVVRLPLVDMVADADQPEIALLHHLRMVDWALRCAYLKHDADTYDEAKALKCEASFERSFGARPDANVMRKQRDTRDRVTRYQEF